MSNGSQVVLWRPHDPLDTREPEAIEKNFYLLKSRTDVLPGDLVIGRYSVLPFYKELEDDVLNQEAKLINSYSEHQYVADLLNWSMDLEDYTPYTWTRLEDLPERGPFVLKGETNSRKDKWKTHMYAETKADAVQVWLRLMDDGLIGTQNIYIRKYVPLAALAVGLNGQPITEEFRFFVCDGKILSGAFYWSSHVNELDNVPSADIVPLDWLDGVIAKVKDNIRFFVIDVAKTASGEWIVVELNDGQMSGLSENDPEVLYKNLRLHLNP